MSESFCHVVQTRFSMRASWGYQEFPLDWLERRLELLDSYCLPSIAAQTCPNFIWQVYCDAATSPAVLAELQRRAERAPQMQVALTGPGGDKPIDHVLAAMRPEDRAVVTTRLDSDDAIATRYVAAIQAHVDAFIESDRETLLLNFPRGFQLDAATGLLNFDWMPRSSFHSLFERPGPELTTVLAGNHSRFHELHPTEHDDSIAAWLMVIHDGNVLNSLREYYTGEANPSRLAEFGLARASSQP